MNRAIILGASRGLGAALAKRAILDGYGVTGFSRKAPAPLDGFEFRSANLAKSEGQDAVIHYLLENPFKKIFLNAGGGPYAPFGQAQFKDHDWAWEVSFRAHARVLHAMAQAGRFEQAILIGSSVAENAGDRAAASYAAAKHALRGLWSSLRLDYPDWDVRLCSPGYMDTSLLPAGAPVREHGVYDPIDIADSVWEWSKSADIGGHKLYPKHPI